MRIRQLRCFQHLNWSPDRAELRRFAVAMLVGFAIIGLIFGLRGHDVARIAPRFIGIGLALAVGAIIPGFGRTVYLAVYIPVSLIGFVVSHILITVIYYCVFTPLGLVIRATGRDLLEIKPPIGRSTWKPHPNREGGRGYYRQF